MKYMPLTHIDMVSCTVERESSPLNPHLSLLLRSFEEKSVDDSNSVGLYVLVSPAVGGSHY